MRIISARFISSAVQKGGYPKESFPEVAFAGRSNVGKSSMINTLVGRKGLVRTSRTPGRTQMINFFLINDKIMLVDLPGYGYAAVPERIRKTWKPMVEDYLVSRKELRCLVLIIDSRLGPMVQDTALAEFLKIHGIPFIVAATKADKLNRSQISALEKAIFGKSGWQAPMVVFSSLNGQGKNELWKEIKNLID
jgi:GTP-binding protein